ncbi:MAG: CCA tRNA nucleotidyltransferase [Bacillota bacterium]
MDTLKAYVERIRSYAGTDIYIAGGFIRDYFLNRKSVDIDIVVKTDALEIAKEFAFSCEGSFIVLDEINGIARVVLKKENLNIDFSDMKGQHIVEDLYTRDFTMNAMAVKIEKDGCIDFEQVIDPFYGKADVEKKIVRMVGRNIFEDDPLRMLRAVRFMSVLGFDLSDDTAAAIKEYSDKICEAVPERISNELFLILNQPKTHFYFNLMDKYLNLLNKIFPEIEPMKDVGQCKYHVVDTWTHSLYTLNVAESIIYASGYFENHLRKAYEEHMIQEIAGGHSRLQMVKLAALFHDIGKPDAKWVDETGRVRFRGHEIVGMEIVERIAERLKFSVKEKKYLAKMVKEHMWPLTLYKSNDVSGRAIYDLFKNFGEDTLDVLLVSLADIIATRKLLDPNEEMGMYKVHVEYLCNNYLTRFKDIVDISHIINGNDIMEAFSLEDHKMIDNMVEEVRKAIFFGRISPDKKKAINYLKDEVLKNQS